MQVCTHPWTRGSGPTRPAADVGARVHQKAWCESHSFCWFCGRSRDGPSGGRAARGQPRERASA
eukprot:15355733-Alexandrium_andersonii.AAC.1